MARLFIVFGPSGVGKSSVVAAALANDTCARVKQIVTCTTRKPRPGEMDGVHYHFVSTQDFERYIAQGELIEWSKAYGTYYGLLRSSVENVLTQGVSAVVLLDRAGVKAAKQEYPSAQVVFLLPPSLNALKERLMTRGANTTTEIDVRLILAEQELAAENKAPLADFAVKNDVFEVAVQAMRTIVCEK